MVLAGVHSQLDHNLSLVEYELVRLEQGTDTDNLAPPEAADQSEASC